MSLSRKKLFLLIFAFLIQSAMADNPPTVTNTPITSIDVDNSYGYNLVATKNIETEILTWSVATDKTLPSWLNLIDNIFEVTTFVGSFRYGSTDGTGTDALFNYPMNMAMDSKGNMFVVDSRNFTIRKVTPTGEVTTFAGYAGDNGFEDGIGVDALFSYPYGIAIDSNDNLFVTDTGNAVIRKITPTGVVTTFAGTVGTDGFKDGTGIDAQFNAINGITIDSNDNLFVVDKYNSVIRKITPSGEVTTFAGNPYELGFTDGSGENARFYFPEGITIDSEGNLFVADSANNAIRKITPTQEVTTIAGGTRGSLDGNGTDAQFFTPRGIAIDSHNNIFVADSDNYTIRKITSTGEVTTVAGLAGEYDFNDANGTDARFRTPRALVIDKNDTIFIADSYNHRIRKMVLKSFLTGTPTYSDIGDYDINLTVTNSIGTTAHDFQITVVDKVTGTVPNQLTLDTESIKPFSTVTLADANEDNVSIIIMYDTVGDLSTYSIPTGTIADVQAELRNIEFTPAISALPVDTSQTTTFIIDVNDGTTHFIDDTTSVIVENINDTPVINIISPTSTVDEDQNIFLTFTVIDVDNNLDDSTITIEEPPTNGTASILEDENVVTYTPNKNFFGNDSFVISTTDSEGAKGTKTVNLTVSSVNDIPIILIDSTLTTNEDNQSSLSFNLIDVEDGNLILNIEANASHGIVTVNESNVIYTPDENYNGTDFFTVSTTDSDGAKVTKVITVSVSSVNDTPVINIDSTLTTNEDNQSSLTFSLRDVEDTDTNLRLIIEEMPSNGSLILDTDNITYTPRENYNGTDTFTVSTTDSDGGKVTKTINVTVSSVNDTPMITIDSTLTTNEDNQSSLNFTLMDIEDENLTLNIEANATNGVVTISGESITYTPNENYNGTDTFTVSTTDSDGAKVTKVIDVTVSSVNDAPVITIDSTLTTNEDNQSSLSFNLLDVEDENLTLDIEANATNGNVTINGNNVIYTPNENFFGTDMFTVSTTDSEELKVTKTINVTVSSVNDTPLINIDSTLTTNEDNQSSLNFTLMDVEDDNLTLNIEVNATHGVVTISGESVTYTPNENYNGTDTFTLSTIDSEGAKGTKVINVTVSSVNDIPMITIDSMLTTDEDNQSSLSFTLMDVEDGNLALAIETNAQNGAVTIDGNRVVYTPNENYNGTDTFTVSTTDSDGVQVTKTINVTVSSINDTPQITIDSTLTTDEDNQSSLSFSLFDVEDGDLTLAIETKAQNGAVTIDGNRVVYTPNENYNGTDTFTVSTTDSDGAKVTKTINVTVSSVNDTPQITIDSTLTTDEDKQSSLTFSLIDVEDTDLTLNVEENAKNGVVTIDGGSVVYTPNENFFGEDSFTVGTTDSDGIKVTQVINATVNSVNDSPVISVESTLSSDKMKDITKNANFESFNINLTGINDVDKDDLDIDIELSDTNIISVSKSWNNKVSYGDYAEDKLYLTVAPKENQSGITKVTVTISDGISTINKEFSIQVIDTIPNDFNFTDKTDEAIASLIESESQRITGIDNGIDISITNGEYRINNGDWSSNKGTINDNDKVTVRLQSSNEYATTVTTNLTIGEITKSFSVTTTSGKIDETIVVFDENIDAEVKETEDGTLSIVNKDDKTIELEVKENGTMNATIEFADENGKSVTSSIKVNSTKSESKVDKEGNINTRVTTETGTVNITLGIDGSVQQIIQSEEGTSSASTEILGSKIEVDTEGNVEIISQVEKNGFIYKAVVKTDTRGKTETKFVKVNVETGEEQDIESTLDLRTPYQVGSQSKILEIDNLIYIKTTTPLSGELIIE